MSGIRTRHPEPGKTLSLVRAALQTAADDWETEQPLVPSKCLEAALVSQVSAALGGGGGAHAEKASGFAAAVDAAVAAAEAAFLASKGDGWRKVMAAEADTHWRPRVLPPSASASASASPSTLTLTKVTAAEAEAEGLSDLECSSCGGSEPKPYAYPLSREGPSSSGGCLTQPSA